MVRVDSVTLFLVLAGTSQLLWGCGKELDFRSGSACFSTANQTNRILHPASAGDANNTLTVMIFNTYLIEQQLGVLALKTMPNVGERAEGIVKWFNSLSFEEVPDVLVLDEIMSDEGELLVRKICSDDFRRRSPFNGFKSKFMKCCEGSHFAFTTVANNARYKHALFMSGGTVVLVKKGLEMTFAHDAKFDSLEGIDVMGGKGYWAVRARKASQPYVIIGTHTLAYGKYWQNRLKQFAQMRKWVDDNVADGERLVYAGDMNIFTHNFTAPDGHRVEGDKLETAGMLKTLGAQGAPVTGGTLVKKGFWLPLDQELDVTWDPEHNHLVGDYEGAHLYDWVLVPGPGDRLASPNQMRRQVVPVLADECYASEAKSGTTGNDLSDHYGVFAQLCYQGPCHQLQEVDGHRGANLSVPSPLNCP
jgi:hypothetical protein